MNNINGMVPINPEHPNNTAGYLYESQGAMRRIMRVSISNTRRVLLEERFPKTRGTVGAFDASTILKGEAMDSLRELYSIFPEVATEATNKGIDLLDVLSCKTYGVNGHQKKSSKVVRELILEAYPNDLAAGSNSNREFEKWLVRHLAKFTSESMDYSIRWDVDAFDMLGDLSEVDARDSARPSCYNPDSEYFPDAPVALAAGFDRDVATFVILASRNRINLGRCWGILDSEGRFILSNGYYSTRGISRDISVFHRISEDATGEVVTFRRIGKEYHEAAYLPIYTNDDGILCWTGSEAPYKGYHSLFAWPSDGTCCQCGEDTHKDHDFIHMFCKRCASGRKNVCRHCNGEIRDALADRWCRRCNQHYCINCWSETHPQCGDCGVRLCPGMNMEFHVNGSNFHWCESCARNREFPTCPVCHEPHTTPECPRGCRVCETCDSEYNIIQHGHCPHWCGVCHDCGQPYDESTDDNANEDHLCPRCREQYCDACETYYTSPGTCQCNQASRVTWTHTVYTA